MAMQRNVTFQAALDRISIVDDSEYEVDVSDDEWEPDSDKTEEEANETVVECGDNTVVLAEQAGLVILVPVLAVHHNLYACFVFVSKN